MRTQGYGLISDIHTHHDELIRRLKRQGYRNSAEEQH